jgi:EPS-associated MarR family transcriptional regulator
MKRETDLYVLRKIEAIEDQKSLAEELGCSVGKVNYIVKALVEKGFVKAERFAKSDNKRGYKYLLTRKGIAEKVRLTKLYIEIKRKEYEELQRELEALKSTSNTAPEH